MANIEGYVTVYESSDGGTGKPCNTFWQFFVGQQPVSTENHWIAETMRLAISTNSKVNVTYDSDKGNRMSQARIEFNYICESRQIQECDMPESKMKVICETRRYAQCEPSDRPDDSQS
jgi:hypothetical protein